MKSVPDSVVYIQYNDQWNEEGGFMYGNKKTAAKNLWGIQGTRVKDTQTVHEMKTGNSLCVFWLAKSVF